MLYHVDQLHNDVIGEFEDYLVVQEMWHQVKIAYGGTPATRLWSMAVKFEIYMIYPTYAMAGHLRVMSAMIHDLNSVCNHFNDDHHILALSNHYLILGSLEASSDA